MSARLLRPGEILGGLVVIPAIAGGCFVGFFRFCALVSGADLPPVAAVAVTVGGGLLSFFVVVCGVVALNETAAERKAARATRVPR